jgi:hypothetical protein
MQGPPMKEQLLEIYSRIQGADRTDLLARLSWVMILLSLGPEPVALLLFVLLFPLVLYSSRISRSPVFWAFAAVLYLASFARSWFVAPHYIYLVACWLFAIALALLSRDPSGVLAFNGRVLLGLVFLLAVAAKAASSDYMSGKFFHYSLLFDYRFELLSNVVCGAEVDTLRAQRSHLHEVFGSVVEPKPMPFQDLSCSRWLVPLLKWWTLAIEALLAVVLLLPGRSLWAIRLALLSIFFVATYALVPIVGFAGVLFVLALAQVPSDNRKLVPVLLAAFLAFLLYSAVFATLIIPVNVR